MQKKSPIKERILQFADTLSISRRKFYERIGVSRGTLESNTGITEDILAKFIAVFPEIDTEWLISGTGEMLRNIDITINKTGKPRKLIPLYNDVSSIGGTNGLSANMDGVSSTTEWIDAGDWFIEATAAIRHYGDSMEEYPSGCILALREIMDWQLIVPGRNYVIETEEYRITKRIQKGKTEDSIKAYSTNEETYHDGTLIHEPIDIPLSAIRKIALVLGYVVKHHSSGMVYTIKKSK